MSRDTSKLDRRSFLVGTGGAGATLTAMAIDASAAHVSARATPTRAAVTLSISGSRGATLDWRAEQAYRFCRALEATAPGDISIVEAELRATADARFLDASDLAALDPAFSFLGGLPGTYALNANDLAIWLDHGGGAQAITALARDHGLHLVLTGYSGSNRLWCRSANGAIAPGTTISTLGLARDVARGLGAVISADACADVIEAGAGPAVTSGLVRHVKAVRATALAPRGTTLVLALTEATAGKLGDERLARLSSLARAHYAAAIAEDRAHTAQIIIGFRSAGGIVEARDDGIAATIEAISRAVIAQTAAAGGAARQIDASYAAFKAATNPENDAMEQYTS